MKDLKKEELLRWLNYWREETVTIEKEESPEPPPFERGQGQQAYQQIKECIGEAFAIPSTSQREGELEEIIIKMQEELDKKPQVTEEWIQEKAEDTASDYPDVAFPNLITIFKKLLKEAGVHVSRTSRLNRRIR